MNTKDNSAPPRTGTFTRALIALAMAHINGGNWQDHARRRWPGSGEKATNVSFTRSTVAATGTSDTSADARNQYVAAVRQREVLSQLLALDVPAKTPITPIGSGLVASVVNEHQAIPHSRPSFGSQISVNPLDVAILCAFHNELWQSGQAEGGIGREMVRGTAVGVDQAFLSTTTGIRNGIDPITSGGSTVADVDYDINELLANLTGADFERTALVVPELVAIGLSLLRDSSGARAYPGISVKGGTLAGLPVLVSKGAPANTLIAIDGSAILRSDEGLSVDASRQATIELSDAPTGDAGTPASMSEGFVNLFQSGLTAIKLIRHVGWEVSRENCIGWISGFTPGDGIVTA